MGKSKKDKSKSALKVPSQTASQVLHDFFLQTPTILAILKGPEYIYQFANPAYLELIGDDNPIGKPLLEAVPEIKGQSFIKLLDNVYNTGEAITKKEMPVKVDKVKGKHEQFYLNFTFQALTNDKGETEGILVFAYNVTELVLARKKLEANALMIRNIYMNAPAAICTFKGPTHIYELINPAYEKLFDKRDLVGKPFLEALPELKGQGVDKILDNIYNTGEIFTSTEIPVNLARADNVDPELRYFNTTMQPIYNEEDKIIGVVNFGYDVTEQIMARKLIEASEKRFSNILTQSLMSIGILKGRDMIVSFANEPLLATWGKGEKIIGKPLLEVMPEIEDQGFSQLLQQVYTTGVPYYGYEIKVNLIRNGKEEPVYYNFVYQPYTEVDNSVTGITILATEVTEQVLAKKQIEASEKQFRIFADSIQNLAWIANDEGRIYWYNQRWYDYTGTTFEEMDGWGWEKVHHPDHVKKVVAFVKEAWGKKVAFELTFPLLRYDGEYRWFLTRAYPVKNSNGNIERWIGTSTDITEQKYFTEELEKKVNERTEELQATNRTLELANAELKSFSYVASHDLKEPLRKIQAYSRRIIEIENFSEKTQDYFNRIISAGERMQNLLDSLLDFSRVNSTELIFEPCDLNTLVEESKEDLQISITEREATIEYKNLPVIMGVRIQISQVITNLLDNSIKYSRPEIKPRIEITSSIIGGKTIKHTSVNKQKKYYAINFADNGIGFEQEYSNKIFELFQRLHFKNEYSGTGIGLAIVKKIVSNHNGFIIAKGKLNKGSTFTIYIPTE